MCLADPSPGVEPGRTGDQSFDRACGSLRPGAPDVEIVERGRSIAERRHLRRELGCLRAVRVLHSRLVGVELDHAEVVAVSYTHLRAHETPEHLVCRLLLEK